MLHLHQALRPSLPLSEIAVLLFFLFFLLSGMRSSIVKDRPLGTVFTCSKIKRSLLNLFVVASLCFEKSAVSE